MLTPFDWIILILVIIALILIFIGFIWNSNFRTNINYNGIAYRVQISPSVGSTDTMLTGGNTLYVVRTSSPNLKLKINADSSQTVGRSFLIKNNSDFNSTITLFGNGVSFRGKGVDGSSATVISAGQLGWYVFTSTNVAERIL